MLRNMKMTMKPIVGALGTSLKGLEIRGRIETIMTTALLISARILRGVQETSGDLMSLRIKSKSLVKTSGKNLQGVK